MNTAADDAFGPVIATAFTPKSASVIGVSEHTLLLDIYQRLSGIEAKQEQMAAEQARSFGIIEAVRHTDIGTAYVLTDVVKRLDAIEPKVSSMAAFRAQMAFVVVFITTAVTGAFNVIYYVLTHMNEMKAALREFLR